MIYVKKFIQFVNESEKVDFLTTLDTDNVWNSLDLENHKIEQISEPEPKNIIQNPIITWEKSDGAKYFDKSTLENYLGFVHPIYNIIEKHKNHTLEFISPESYLRNIAIGFGVSAADILNDDSYNELAYKYAESMRNGAKFPIGYYTIGKSDQEGRHRAFACKLLKCNTIPVVRIDDLDSVYVENFVQSLIGKDKKDLESIFGVVSDLDLRELETYIKYRLD